ncbi:MAG: hypothetical protein M3483_01110 [Gemmatimonadota bacterium]|nr:hypothetical protein [Gemmatimonadota bacterium]
MVPHSAFLARAIKENEQARPWKRSALIGAVIGGASGAAVYYFAIESTPENRAIDSWFPSWIGYATFAIPGALVGGLVGAAIGLGDFSCETCRREE